MDERNFQEIFCGNYSCKENNVRTIKQLNILPWQMNLQNIVCVHKFFRIKSNELSLEIKIESKEVYDFFDQIQQGKHLPIFYYFLF